MTKEEKQLSLIDFCARLLHGVKVKILDEDVIPYEPNDIGTIVGKEYINDDIYTIKCERESWCLVIYKHFIPYLRPMSSMTVEEICKIEAIIGNDFRYNKDSELMACSENVIKLPFSKIHELMEFFYQRHIDVNGLIPMGLALEAPEGMYKIVPSSI